MKDDTKTLIAGIFMLCLCVSAISFITGQCVGMDSMFTITNEHSKFVGTCTWTSAEGDTGTYSQDGTYVYRYAEGTTFTGTWVLSDDQLIISYPSEGYTHTFDYYFENNDNTLYKMLVGEDHYDVWTKIT